MSPLLLLTAALALEPHEPDIELLSWDASQTRELPPLCLMLVELNEGEITRFEPLGCSTDHAVRATELLGEARLRAVTGTFALEVGRELPLRFRPELDPEAMRKGRYRLTVYPDGRWAMEPTTRRKLLTEFKPQLPGAPWIRDWSAPGLLEESAPQPQSCSAWVDLDEAGRPTHITRRKCPEGADFEATRAQLEGLGFVPLVVRGQALPALVVLEPGEEAWSLKAPGRQSEHWRKTWDSGPPSTVHWTTVRIQES